MSREGQTVLDPFMGSGTTAVAAKKLNRNFIGFELNQGYYEICQTRLGEKQQAYKKEKERSVLTLFEDAKPYKIEK